MTERLTAGSAELIKTIEIIQNKRLIFDNNRRV